nr:hypothetical protein CFP56_46654 [Quercus suber]
MATTTSAFASLQPPSHEDTMDMSSPAHRPDDTDIDIDIDFTYNDDTLINDDQMLDNDQTRPPTATDTAMDDDLDDTLVQEADMIDHPGVEVVDESVVDAATEEDDELIDYDEDEYAVDEHFQDVVPKESDSVSVQANDEQQEETPIDQTAHEEVHAWGNASTVSQAADMHGDANHDDAAISDEEPHQPDHRQKVPIHDIPQDEEVATEAQRSSQTDIVAPIDHLHRNQSKALAHGEAGGIPGDVATGNDTIQATFIDTRVRRASDVPATPTDTGLHHMILQFGASEIPLFRSRQMPGGLLTNDNLAGHHLADLISNCKERLQETENADFSDDEECTLQFQAYKCTLNDVLNVYLLLHQNAGTESVPPLFLTLTIVENFTHVLDSLKLAAESGQGIPNVQYSEEENEDGQYFEENEDEHEPDGDLPEDDDQEQYLDTAEHDIDGPADENRFTEDDNNDYPSEYEVEVSNDEDHPQSKEIEQQARPDDPTDERTVVHQEQKESAAITASSPSAPAYAPSAVEESSSPDSFSKSGDANLANGQGLVVASSDSSGTIQTDHDNITGEYDSGSEVAWCEDEFLINDLLDTTDNHRDTFVTEKTASNHEADQIRTPETAVNVIQVIEPENSGQDHLPKDYTVEQEDNKDHDSHTGLDNEAHGNKENHRFPVDQTELNGNKYNEKQFLIEYEQPDAARNILNNRSGQTGPEREDSERDYLDEDHSQTDEGAFAATETYEDPNEIIDFDDDTPAEHEARKGSPVVATTPSSDSPLGKRSFEEHADEGLYDDDEPELKKARSG